MLSVLCNTKLQKACSWCSMHMLNMAVCVQQCKFKHFLYLVYVQVHSTSSYTDCQSCAAHHACICCLLWVAAPTTAVLTPSAQAAAAALMNLASEERNIRSAIVACNGIQALVVVLKVWCCVVAGVVLPTALMAKATFSRLSVLSWMLV